MLTNRKALLSLFIFGCLSLSISESWANVTASFKVSKKAEKVDQRRTVSTGSRSSCQPSVKPGTLELLVPEQEVYHTTSEETPTMYVYSHKAQPVNLEFVLQNLSETEPVYRKQISIDSTGATAISLPDKIQLLEEEKYTWNIVIPCYNNLNNNQTVLSAGIKYSKPSDNLDIEISNAKSISEKIQIYSQNEIWYQTIDLAIKQREKLGYTNHLYSFNQFFNNEPEKVKKTKAPYRVFD